MQRLLPILILAVLVVGPATAYVPDTLTVTFLDVGQGDSILVQAPNGHAMLLDAGESWAAPAVSAGLAAEGITQLDYVIATHDHDDHIGGMAQVLPEVTVGAFLTNGMPASTVTVHTGTGTNTATGLHRGPWVVGLEQYRRQGHVEAA